MTDSPVRPYRTIVRDSGDPGYTNRIMIATPVTGLVRIEWVQARYGQIVPTNWSMVQYLSFMDSFYPLRYQVSDAQNLAVHEALERDFEWLLLWEHDTCPPGDALVRINEYIKAEDIPVVSGLYYTRSRPSEPLLYRGRGNGPYTQWALGDLVWVDGVPTGFLLVHMGIVREMAKDAEWYTVRGQTVRRIFDSPFVAWRAPDSTDFYTMSGTSDLDWCTRVMKGDYMRKAGWSKHVDAHPDWPFLVDTNIFCRHVNPNGEVFP